MKLDEDIQIWKKGRSVWIPNKESLIERLMIIAHCGMMGHRERKAMQEVLSQYFYIENLVWKIQCFVESCLLCPYVKGHHKIQRPPSQLWHAKKPNEGIHFDYLYLGASLEGPKYVLVIKDDFSHYCELVASETASAQVCVDALIDWGKRFGLPSVWISDQGTHFKNKIMQELADL